MDSESVIEDISFKITPVVRICEIDPELWSLRNPLHVHDDIRDESFAITLNRVDGESKVLSGSGLSVLSGMEKILHVFIINQICCHRSIADMSFVFLAEMWPNGHISVSILTSKASRNSQNDFFS